MASDQHGAPAVPDGRSALPSRPGAEAASDGPLAGAEPAGEAAAPQIVPPRPAEAAHDRAPHRVLGLIGTYAAGFGMGSADVVPGFSGGTVALVAGIYERLVANIRQVAHVLSLLLRGRVDAALRAFQAIEWLFVIALVAGVLTAVFTLSARLTDLLDRFPIPMAAVFLGLVLGAAAVAQRELRAAAWYHVPVVAVVAVLTFVGLGWSPGTLEDPSLLLVFGAVAVAACAMILPGVSGSFLLVVLGMYTVVVAEGFGERNVAVMLVAVLGAATGLALFSTLLNFLLRRWHDLILAALLGLMVGSARVLWPWPDGIDSTELGLPEGNDWLLAMSLAMAAFAAVWLLALLIPSPNERARQRRAREEAERAAAEHAAAEHAAAERAAAERAAGQAASPHQAEGQGEAHTPRSSTFVAPPDADGPTDRPPEAPSPFTDDPDRA